MSIHGFPYPHSIVTVDGAAAATPIPCAIRAGDTLVCAVAHPAGAGAVSAVLNPTAATVANGSVTFTPDTSAGRVTLIWVNQPV